MGTICAPAYANIFMTEFEQKYVYPLIKDKSILFLRYIDIFMVWTKSEKQLKDFMSELNQKHPSIKFHYRFHCKQIEFLNTLVYIDQQNKLQTTLTSILIKEKYSLQPSTLNSADMLNIPRIPQSL